MVGHLVDVYGLRTWIHSLCWVCKLFIAVSVSDAFESSSFKIAGLDEVTGNFSTMSDESEIEKTESDI